MGKKKNVVVVSAIITIAIAAGVLVWSYENNKSLQTDQQISTQNATSDNSESKREIEISDNWTLVSHYNFWNNTEKFKTPNKNRFPGIKFSYPDNWEFKCCGDMDHASENFINPPNRDSSSPYIRITTYVLRDCQNSKEKCSLDEQIAVTAKEKFNRLVLAISKDQILPETAIKNLDLDAFTYKKIERDEKSSKAYLLNLPDGVVEIDFVNYELLDEKFIENFLNHIEFEK